MWCRTLQGLNVPLVYQAKRVLSGLLWGKTSHRVKPIIQYSGGEGERRVVPVHIGTRPCGPTERVTGYTYGWTRTKSPWWTKGPGAEGT